MEFQVLLNAALAIASAATGWILRIIWDAQKELRRDLQSIEKQLPETYVRRDDWRDQMKRIEDMLGKIFDKLDSKVDK